MAIRAAQRDPHCPLSSEALSDLLLVAVLGGVIGGRLFYVVLNWSVYVAHPWESVALWHGGLVFYGGFAGGVLGTVWFLRRRLAAQPPGAVGSFLRVIDLLMPSLALAQSIGRLGCFFNGCCYGRPTDAVWGMPFPQLPGLRYPTQLLESLATLALFVVLYGVQRRLMRRTPPAAPGVLTGLYCILYGLMRFGIEFLRGDNPPWWLSLTISQWIGVVLVPLGAALFMRRASRHAHVV